MKSLHNLKHLYIIISFLVFSCCHGFAQEGATSDHFDHNHEHSHEISLAVGIVPLPAENQTTVGFHLHYIRGIGESKRFGMGLALETILDEHKHYTASVVAQYRIYKGLSLAYAPGALFLAGKGIKSVQLANHIEVTYEFELGNFHIGPVAEIGIEKSGTHYMGGVHFGVDI